MGVGENLDLVGTPTVGELLGQDDIVVPAEERDELAGCREGEGDHGPLHFRGRIRGASR